MIIAKNKVMKLTSKTTKINGSCLFYILNCSVWARRMISIGITFIQVEEFCSLTAGMSGKINFFTQRISSQSLRFSVWCVFSNGFSITLSFKKEQNVPELEKFSFIFKMTDQIEFIFFKMQHFIISKNKGFSFVLNKWGKQYEAG